MSKGTWKEGIKEAAKRYKEIYNNKYGVLKPKLPEFKAKRDEACKNLENIERHMKELEQRRLECVEKIREISTEINTITNQRELLRGSWLEFLASLGSRLYEGPDFVIECRVYTDFSVHMLNIDFPNAKKMDFHNLYNKFEYITTSRDVWLKQGKNSEMETIVYHPPDVSEVFLPFYYLVHPKK